MMLSPSQCSVCANALDKRDDRSWFTCAAYPDGIPEEIYTGAISHNVARPGDQGIRFIPSKTESATQLARVAERFAAKDAAEAKTA